MKSYGCTGCRVRFSQKQSRGKDIDIKLLAITLYLNGLSLRAIAKIVKVSHKAVSDWVKAFGLEGYDKSTSAWSVVIGFDEMLHLLNSKKAGSGYGRHLITLHINSLTGKVEGVTMLP